MVDVLILSLVPAAIALFAWWAHSLPLAFLGMISVYVMFLWFAFRMPFAFVAAIWLAYALALIPFQLLRFPGQYTPRRFVPNLYAWPMIAMVTAIAEQDETVVADPSEIPGTFEGTVSFIETTGTETDYIMVFLEEYGETVFYAIGSLESEDGLREDARVRLEVERRDIGELGGEILWVAAASRIARTSAT